MDTLGVENSWMLPTLIGITVGLVSTVLYKLWDAVREIEDKNDANAVEIAVIKEKVKNVESRLEMRIPPRVA